MRKRNKWIELASYSDMQADPTAKTISKQLGITLAAAQLLVNRGCMSTAEAKAFFAKEEEQMYDPFLMSDMDEACMRIIEAIEEGEKIVIFGDYDVDGVTSVSSLYLYLESKGADVDYYIPSRLGEGYGMSEGAIRKLKDNGCKLIVTVDTGITAVSEASLISELGMELVITDHHECHDEIPSAVAVVNPKRPDCEYPFTELAGVGVVFKLLCALEQMLNPELGMSQCVRTVAGKYADLVAIGTIADVMPIKDENRLIVSYGLSLIETNERPGLVELMEATRAESKYNTKRKITASYIGFTLAPRINAAGRVRDASIAVQLFLAKTREEAAPIAKILCDINHERQDEENKITEQAYAQIAAEHDFENDRVIVLANESWHHGIIGIVASRITDKYSAPSILISFEGSEDIGKGSGRSIKGLNLVETLGKCSHLLEKYGGHELAAGLSIKRENLDEFRREINECAKEVLLPEMLETQLEAECELKAEDITMQLAEELYYFEPFGVSNPVPVFVLRGVKLHDAALVGGGKHTKLTLSLGKTTVCAMCFRHTLSDLDLYSGDTVDVMFTMDINEFQNQRSVQLIVKDIRLSDKEYEREKRERELYRSVKKRIDGDEEKLSDFNAGEIVPERADFAAVYSTLRKELRVEHEVFSLRALLHLLRSNGCAVNYTKLRFILSVFSELSLLNVKTLSEEDEIFAFGYVYMKNKTDLERSVIFRKLKAEFIKG